MKDLEKQVKIAEEVQKSHPIAGIMLSYTVFQFEDGQLQIGVPSKYQGPLSQEDVFQRLCRACKEEGVPGKVSFSLISDDEAKKIHQELRSTRTRAEILSSPKEVCLKTSAASAVSEDLIRKGPDSCDEQPEEKKAPRKVNHVLCGRPIPLKNEISLSMCTQERTGCVTRGIVVSVNVREYKEDKGVLHFRLTNYDNILDVTSFVVMSTYRRKMEKSLVKGATVLVRGDLLMDPYTQDLCLKASSITLCAEPLAVSEEKKKEYDSMITGRPFHGDAVPIHTALEKHYQGEIIVEGDILSSDPRDLRNDRKLLTLNITDYTDAVTVKMYTDEETLDKNAGALKKGKTVRVKGMMRQDEKYSQDFEIMVSSMMPIKKQLRPQRQDTSKEKRVELHLHTKISEMDAVTRPRDMVLQASRWGHRAVAITDHGAVQGFPEAMDAAKECGIKVIYGMEAYVVDDLEDTVKGCGDQTLDSPYVVFDIETTGFDKKLDKIIEIGAVKVENGQITGRFSHYVDPEQPIPAGITQLTTITDADVAGQGTIREVLPEFLAFAADSVLVAHNASFDIGFIRRKNEEIGGEALTNPVLDTLGLSRGLFDLRRYTLDSVAKAAGVKLANHHRAVDDAEATAGIFLKCLALLSQEGITRLDEVNAYIHQHTDVRRLRSHHAILLVRNLTGLHNLYQIVSESHLNYFYRHALTPKSLINRLREGILVGSACSMGELYPAVLEHDTDDVVDRIVSFYDYLEIQPVANNRYLIDDPEHPYVKSDEDLREINRRIVALGEKYGKRVCATSDAHFLDPSDEIFRRILLSGMKYENADRPMPLYFHTTNEMLEEFSYLGEQNCHEVVIDSPNAIADMVESILPVPEGQFSPVIDGAEEELTRVCYENAKARYGDPLPEIVDARLRRELDCINRNGFATLYILARRLVQHSLADGYYVGSRGSVGSSFAATMAGISEVNPLKAHYYCPKCHFSDFDPPEARGIAGMSGFDLPDRSCPVCGTKLKKDGQEIPFEVFLGFDGDKEPDIDLNFSGEYQPRAHAYVEEMFGKGHVFRAGTMSGLADKTAYGMVRHYLEDHHESLSEAQIMYLVCGCMDVKKTTGQHPGGLIIVPKGYDVYKFTPVQHPADDPESTIITTHFDYNQLHGRLLKLDILGHDDPTMVRMLEDLTKTKATEVPLDDPAVMSLFTSTEALGVTPEQIGSPVGTYGISEFGTRFVRGMLVDTKPKSFSDLVRISGLSHGTNVWNNNAKNIVDQGIAPISKCICTREDIMLDLIALGMDKLESFKIMEKVRKGKKSGGMSEENIRHMIEHGVPEWYLESCRKIQYLFPKGHAVAYVTMSLRIAYYKVHYKEAYYAAFFTIRANSFDYETMAMGEQKARRAKEELEAMDMDAMSAKDKERHTLLELIVEFYCRGLSFLPMSLEKSDAHKFQIVGGKLLPPFDTISGMGQQAAQSIVTAREDGPFTTMEDFLSRTKVSRTIAAHMKELGIMGDMSETDQLSLF